MGISVWQIFNQSETRFLEAPIESSISASKRRQRSRWRNKEEKRHFPLTSLQSTTETKENIRSSCITTFTLYDMSYVKFYQLKNSFFVQGCVWAEPFSTENANPFLFSAHKWASISLFGKFEARLFNLI